MRREPPSLDVMTHRATTNNFFAKGGARGRGQSFDHAFPGSMTSTVKPRVLESKVSENKDFYNLSDGFKKIFADDKKDRKLVVPVCGFGGHRRGDRSQNYFGKSFRDTTI